MAVPPRTERGEIREMRPPFRVTEEQAERLIGEMIDDVTLGERGEWVELFEDSHIPRPAGHGSAHPGFSCKEDALVRAGNRRMLAIRVNLASFDLVGSGTRYYNTFYRGVSLAFERRDKGQNGEKAYLKVKKLLISL